MISIKKLNGTPRCSVEINKGSTRKAELMKEDYIILKFSLIAPCVFEIGDYVDFASHADEYPLLQFMGRYEIIDPQNALPTYNANTGGYDYSLRLEAYYYKWANKVLKFAPYTIGSESEWSITATIANIGTIITQNLENLSFKCPINNRDFKVQIANQGIDDPSEMLTLTFDGDNIIDALTKIANAANDGRGCDWWVDKEVIYFGKCEKGEQLTIAPSDNAASISRSNGENDMTNRVYAFGSQENIPLNYRRTLRFEVDHIESAPGFADRSRILDRDCFNPDAIIIQEEYIQLSGIYWNAMERKGEGSQVTIKHKAQIRQATKLARYKLDIDGHLNYKLNLTDYKEEEAKGTAIIRIYADTGQNGWSGLMALAKFEFQETVTDNSVQIILTPDFETYALTFPKTETSDGFNLRYEVEFNFETNYDLANLTLGPSSSEITEATGFKMYNLSAPFYAKIQTVKWMSTAYQGKEYWVKVEPNYKWGTSFFTLITPQTRNGDGTFTTQSLAANVGDRFVFVKDEDGRDFIRRSYVPSSYYQPRYSEQLNGMVVTRLLLPSTSLYEDAEGNISTEYAEGKTVVYTPRGYIDAKSGLDKTQIVESVQYFDDIKPTYDGTIGAIGVKTEDEKYENGEKTGAKIYNYVFKDTILKNFKNKNSLSEGNMQITFSSGKCNGLTFEVEVYSGLLDDGTRAKGTGSDGTWLRIVPNETYAVQMPNQYIYPAAGDKYNLSGYDVTIIDTLLIEQAEIKLFKKAREWLEGRAMDQSTYQVTMNSYYTKKLMVDDPGEETVLMFDDGTAVLDDLGRKIEIEAPSYSPTYTESRLTPYFIGRKVKLQDPGLFTSEGRETRIIAIEHPLDFPWDNAKLTCGETAAYSRLKKIEKQIAQL